MNKIFFQYRCGSNTQRGRREIITLNNRRKIFLQRKHPNKHFSNLQLSLGDLFQDFEFILERDRQITAHNLIFFNNLIRDESQNSSNSKV